MEKYGIEPYNEATGKGLVRHVLIRYGYFTKEVMVCLILNGNKLPKEEQLVKSLCEIPGILREMTEKYGHGRRSIRAENFNCSTNATNRFSLIIRVAQYKREHLKSQKQPEKQ